MAREQRNAVAGLGVTLQGEHPASTSTAIKAEAMSLALDDAGLHIDDIDGVVTTAGFVDQGVYGCGGVFVKSMGLTPNFVWDVQTGGASAIAAISMACWAVEHGHARHVAIVYGDRARSARVQVGEAGDVGGGLTDRDTMGAYGMFSPGADHALGAQRHMHLYGTTPEQLGAIALTSREYANRRPDAFMHDKPLTLDDYLATKMIADPLRRGDYCLVADGGCALIVTSLDRARALRSHPVRIDGIGLSAPFREIYRGSQYDQIAVAGARDKAFAAAGATLDDIDVAQIYDCFTIAVLLALEGYGFCPRGGGGPFVADGNLRLDGAIPTNTAGGELSWSYLQGFTPLVEGLRQMRHESGATQVEGAETGLVTAQGGATMQGGDRDLVQTCLVLRRDR